MRRLIIALDMMSGDFGVIVTIPAAIQALDLYPKLELLLVGNPDIINSILIKLRCNCIDRITIIPSESVIDSNIKPSQAIRKSHGTSMRISLELIKSGYAHACVSAGNTGALMGLATLLLKPLKGIYRPALTVILPNQCKGKTIILDLGANIVCNSVMLTQFAIMGSVLAEQVIGISNPRVSLLNIGAEEIKGLDNIREAAKLLRSTSSIYYIGYLEANELLSGKTDVVVCDGFIGNIALKTMEGIVKVFLSSIHNSERYGKLGWLMNKINNIIKKRLINSFGSLHPDQYNGASLLGLRGIVVKSHGAANERAFIAAIKQAMIEVEQQIPERISANLISELSKKYD